MADVSLSIVLPTCVYLRLFFFTAFCIGALPHLRQRVICARFGSTMDKDTSAIKNLHHLAKSMEIPRERSIEIHRNMDVRHAEASDYAPFIGKSVVRRWKCEVDDRLKTSIVNRAKLTLGGLAGSAKFVTDGTETVNLRQHGASGPTTQVQRRAARIRR